MSHSTPVPSDVEATSLLDLVADCRAVAALLGGDVLALDDAPLELVIDLVVPAQRPRVLHVPLSRMPLDRMPAGYGAMPAELTDHLLLTVVGGLEDPAEL